MIRNMTLALGAAALALGLSFGAVQAAPQGSRLETLKPAGESTGVVEKAHHARWHQHHHWRSHHWRGSRHHRWRSHHRHGSRYRR